jgi:hypothetical protein
MEMDVNFSILPQGLFSGKIKKTHQRGQSPYWSAKNKQNKEKSV